MKNKIGVSLPHKTRGSIDVNRKDYGEYFDKNETKFILFSRLKNDFKQYRFAFSIRYILYFVSRIVFNVILLGFCVVIFRFSKNSKSYRYYIRSTIH